MLVDQKVKIAWTPFIKKHYESLGYKWTKQGDYFYVDIKHLTESSGIKVKFICDYCNGKNQTEEKYKWKPYQNLMRKRFNNKDCCRNRECVAKKLAETNETKEISIDRNFAYKFPDMAKEWDYDKNNKNPEDYTYGSKKLVWWKCEKGHEWYTSINSRTNSNTGCPTCKSSKGEKRIKDFLEFKNIKFIQQFEFEDLIGINGGLLKFDFAVFDNNNVLKLLIEYDGEYHFRKVYDGDGHERLIVHDNIKNDYCKNKSIPLIRIKYTSIDKIEDILFKELNNYLNINYKKPTSIFTYKESKNEWEFTTSLFKHINKIKEINAEFIVLEFEKEIPIKIKGKLNETQMNFVRV